MFGRSPRSPRRRQLFSRASICSVAAIVEPMESRCLLATMVTAVAGSGSYEPGALTHDFVITGLTPSEGSVVGNVLQVPNGVTTTSVTLSGKVYGPDGAPPSAFHGDENVLVSGTNSQGASYSATFQPLNNNKAIEGTDPTTGQPRAELDFNLVISNLTSGQNTFTYQAEFGSVVVDVSGLSGNVFLDDLPSFSPTQVPADYNNPALTYQPPTENVFTFLDYSDADEPNARNVQVSGGTAAPGGGTSVTTSQGGTFTLLNSTGDFQYTPKPGFSGTTDSVALLVSDGVTTPQTVTLTFNVQNDIPMFVTNDDYTQSINPGDVAQPITSGSPNHSTPVTLMLKDNDDPTTSLVYTLTAAPTAGKLLLSGVALDVSNLAGNPPKFTQADVDSGKLTYQQTNPNIRQDSFAVTATDSFPGHPMIGPQTIKIAVSTGPSPPTITMYDQSATPPPYSNDAYPTFTLTGAPANSTVNVYATNTSTMVTTQLPITVSAANGDLLAKVTKQIPDGTYTFQATSVDSKGVESYPRGTAFGPVTIVSEPLQLSNVSVSPSVPAGTDNFIVTNATPPPSVAVSATVAYVPGVPFTVTVTEGGTELGMMTYQNLPAKGAVSVVLKDHGGLTEGTNALVITAVSDAKTASSTAFNVVQDTKPPQFVQDTTPAQTPLVTLAHLVKGTGVANSATATPATLDTTPTVSFNVQDQEFASVPNTVTVTGVLSQPNQDITTTNPGTQVFKTSYTVLPNLDPTTKVMNTNFPFSVALAGTLSQGIYQLRITATDSASNSVQAPDFTFQVVGAVAGPTAGAPGTPAYTTVYSLASLEQTPNPDGLNPSVYPWTTSFDRTTQTAWVDLRGTDMKTGGSVDSGNSVAQIDPATRTFKLYNLEKAFQATGKTLLNNSGPHGIFFDFESNITPRVWFTSLSSGLISYLDLTDPKNATLHSYDVTQALNSIPALHDTTMAGPHAVVVDAHGHVWISDHDDHAILELIPDPSGQSTTLQLRVHREPVSVRGYTPDAGGMPVSGPHGIDTTIDANGQTYVWFTQLKVGHIVLLEPGAGPNGTDLWKDFPVTTSGGYPLFPSIDTIETPDAPQDDKIYFSDPGLQAGLQGGTTGNAIYSLDPNTGLVKTWTIPVPPGAPTPQINEVFVDREGNVFYIDRQNGVGRLDPLTPATQTKTVTPRTTTGPSNLVYGVLTKALTPYANYDFGKVPSQPLKAVPDANLITTPQLSAKGTTTLNSSQTPGVNEYSDTGINNFQKRGAGPFRGALSAGNNLYGSLTQNDQISVTTFAETDRRPMAAVVTPNGSRYAFQTVRDGSVTPTKVRLIATVSAPGQLVSRQGDLQTGTGAYGLVGDPTAVVDAQGVVHAFVRNQGGGLTEYTPTATGGWTVTLLPSPGAGSGQLAANPTAFLDPMRGPGVAVTTSSGHLVVYYPNLAQKVFDLTPGASDATPGSSMVMYSSPGVVVSQGRVFVYGTDQAGRLLEFSYLDAAGTVSTDHSIYRAIPLVGSGLSATVPTQAFQDVTAVVVNGVRNVFVTDGNSQLLHVTISGSSIVTENITAEAAGNAIGYIPYEQPYAGRVYSGVSAIVDPSTGRLTVYGTNGRDLIQFVQLASGKWQVTDLTNSVSGTSTTLQSANRVFGAPAAYVDPNGTRHIFSVNEFGEVINYYQLAPGAPLSTVDITLITGNSTASSPQVVNPSNPMPTVSAPANNALQSTNGVYYSGYGTLANLNDSATFQYSATSSAPVTITLASLAGMQVPILKVYDALGNLVGTNTHGLNVSKTLTTTLAAGQTYTLKVSPRPKALSNFQILLGPASVGATPQPSKVRSAAILKPR